jgi:hypothetical protein
MTEATCRIKAHKILKLNTDVLSDNFASIIVHVEVLKSEIRGSRLRLLTPLRALHAQIVERDHGAWTKLTRARSCGRNINQKLGTWHMERYLYEV